MNHSFTVGAATCWAIHDGLLYPSASMLFGNPAHWDLVLFNLGMSKDRIPTPMNCLLIQLENELVLIDTGRGVGEDTGQLIPNLRAAGFAPDDITMVILSHSHIDHIGGVLGPDELPAFPRARYLISRADWNHCPSVSAMAMLQMLQPDFIRTDRELLPGLTAHLAPGHTPGQVVIRLDSMGETLLYAADLVAHPFHITYPHWNTGFDHEPELAIQTRAEWLNRAKNERWRVYCYHFPLPGII